MAFGSQQYPRQQYTTGPASDRPLLAGKPVQGATSTTPDSRYASVAPSKPVADIVKEYANFVKPIQTSDKPRSIESIVNPVQSQASSKPSTNAFSAFTNQYGGAENIGNMQGINSNVAGIEGTAFNNWDDTTKNAIRNDISNPLTGTNQQTDTSINLVLSDLKADIDGNNTIDDLMGLYPDVPAEILPDLYTDIKNGTSLLEIKGLYPELQGIKPSVESGEAGKYDYNLFNKPTEFLQEQAQKDGPAWAKGAYQWAALGTKGLRDITQGGAGLLDKGISQATDTKEIYKSNVSEDLFDITQGFINTAAAYYAPTAVITIGTILNSLPKEAQEKVATVFNDVGGFIGEIPGLKQLKESLPVERQQEFEQEVLGAMIGLLLGAKNKGNIIKNPKLFFKENINPKNILTNIEENVFNIPSKFVPKNTGPKPKVGPDNAKAKQVAGEIIQGKEKQQQAAATTLTDIDMKGVKTYKEASTKVGEHQKKIIKAEDDYLSKDVVSYTKADTVIETKVGEVTIKQDFISDGIADLKDIYKGDAVKLEELNQIEAKYNNEGLTLKEQNDFARRYNTDTPKGFNVMGDPLTGVTKVRQEKTRTGIKTTIKKHLPDGGEYLTKLDKKYSDSVTTKKLLDKMDERVNKMKQKGADTSRLEKIVTKLWDTYQLVTTPIRYAIGASRPKKSLTALDLEAKLPKFLKKLDQIVTESGKTNNNLGREAYQKQVELMTRTIEREIEIQRQYNSETTKTEDFEKSTLGEKPALGEGKSESIVAGSSLESDKNAGAGNQSLGLPIKQQNQTPSQLEQGNQKTNIEGGLKEAGQKQKPSISVDQSLSRGDSSRDKTLGNDVVNTASRSDNSKNTSSIIDNTKPVSTPKPKTILDTIVAKKIAERKAKVVEPVKEVVSNKSNQRVLYHGTNVNFENFEKSSYGTYGRGVYLSPDKAASDFYAGLRAKDGGKATTISSSVDGDIKVFNNRKSYEEYAMKNGLFDNKRGAVTDIDKLNDIIKKEGYVGIEIVKGGDKGDLHEVIVFDPKNVKVIKDIQSEKIMKAVDTVKGAKVAEPVSSDLLQEARKYKTADEFVDGLRNKYSTRVEELTKKQKLENPGDPLGYNKAKEDFYNKNGITKSDLEVIDNKKYANIKGMEDSYTQYKNRGQDAFAEQTKRNIEEAKKSNAIFDKYDKVSEQRDNYYKANEKDIMLSANKWMNKDDADFVMMIKHDLPPVSKLKQIWEEANTSQANKEPQTPTKPQGEKPKNDVLSRAIDKVKSKKVETPIKVQEDFALDTNNPKQELINRIADNEAKVRKVIEETNPTLPKTKIDDFMERAKLGKAGTDDMVREILEKLDNSSKPLAKSDYTGPKRTSIKGDTYNNIQEFLDERTQNFSQELKKETIKQYMDVADIVNKTDKNGVVDYIKSYYNKDRGYYNAILKVLKQYGIDNSAKDINIYNALKDYNSFAKSEKGGIMESINPKTNKMDTKLYEEARKYKSAEEFVKEYKDSSSDTLYHGTNADFKEFDTNKIGKGVGSKIGEGVYLTDSKDTASKYAEKITRDSYNADIIKNNSNPTGKFYTPDKGEGVRNIMTVKVKDGVELGDISEQKIRLIVAKDGGNVNIMSDSDIGKVIQKRAKSKGYGGVKYKQPGMDSTTVVVYNPKDVEIRYSNTQLKKIREEANKK